MVDSVDSFGQLRDFRQSARDFDLPLDQSQLRQAWQGREAIVTAQIQDPLNPQQYALLKEFQVLVAQGSGGKSRGQFVKGGA
jgi:hypothetical protein